MFSRRRPLLLVAVCAVGALVAPAPADAAVSRCKPIKNPYAGTRYEGTDIRRIRTVGATCRRARRVARGAHRKALGMPPSPSPVRRFRWNGWRVTGDLRGSSDSYRAVRGGKRVRWIF